MPVVQYVYRGVVARVVDGDTLDIDLDQGLRNTRRERLRLRGVNAPEMARAGGSEAKVYVEAWVTEHMAHARALTVETYKTDNWGRWVAVVWCPEEEACLNADLVDSGHATWAWV
jgi:micrococcal nuclease